MDDMNKTNAEHDPEVTENGTQAGALELCKKETAEWKDKYARVIADFDNYKRRAEKERAQWTHASQANLILQLLPIVDDFDRVMTELQHTELSPELKTRFAGIEMIGKSLHKLLKAWHVTEITETIHFDPTLHEAVMTVEDPTKQPDDIVQVLEKGYLFKDEVLRPAKVSVVKS